MKRVRLSNYNIFRIVSKKLLPLLLLSCSCFGAGCPFQPEPIITWENSFGGSSLDRAYSIQQTTDGGFILAGQTSSFSAGGYDFYVIKLDALGTVEWQNHFGGSSAEIARSVYQTSDGGYVVAGRSSSFSELGSDFYIVKLDSDGNQSWEKVYGGDDNFDDAWSIQQTADSGYIVAGYTEISSPINNDAYVMKLDSGGNEIWSETYGGTEDDGAMAVQQTADGGYVVAGYTASSGAGGRDLWVIKLDSSGAVTWEETYGGAENDEAWAIHQTADDGYIVAGSTESSGSGGKDMWALRLNNSGTLLGEETYGETEDDEARSIRQTPDRGYILAGYRGSAGNSDMYVAKLTIEGNITWERTFGEEGDDKAYAVQRTADGGYIVAGYIHPTDATGVNDDDIYVLKLNEQGEL
jgi:uncharacterized delta-60 repeat protein